MTTRLLSKHPIDVAMSAAVGGEFEAVGILERELLIHLGLKPQDYLIDVGCGSGRLAQAIASYLTGPYLGIDVVPEMLEYAKNIAARPDWRFEVVEGFEIPERDGCADVITFFSVFTHLLHEESFCYLRDAKRVCKPTGRIIFSFLEYAIHRDMFERTVQDVGVNEHPLNVFISHDAVKTWADMLGLSIVEIIPGDQKFIPLSQPLTFSSGVRMEGITHFGQSVCVLAL